MKVFGWSEHHCRCGIPGHRGWIWYYWALENEATVFGKLMERRGKGYIALETDRLMDEARRIGLL